MVGDVELSSEAVRAFEALHRPARGRLLMGLTFAARDLRWPGLLTVWAPAAVAAGEVVRPGGPMLVYAILEPRRAYRLLTGRVRGLTH
jgi:hypothetical protein